MSINSGLAALEEIDETTVATLRFGNDRLATFVTSFNAANVAAYRLVGTKGDLPVDPAYECAEGLSYALNANAPARYRRAQAVAFRLHPRLRMRRTRRPAGASPETRPSILRVGCSGWQYRHWRGDFYPNAVPFSRWLEYYASHFDTVEINNSFYRLPTAATFATWRDRVPPEFVYAVKASRYITHLKKLKDPVDPLKRLFSRAVKLRRTSGPVLYQLPPRWPLNLGRLRQFLAALPKRPSHAVEFRDPSWYVEDVFAGLRAQRVALCLHDMADSSTGLKMVGPFVYVRFHGPSKYRGAYDERRLRECAAWCAARLGDGIPIYAYFNNDIGGHAPRDAMRFRAMTVAALGRG